MKLVIMAAGIGSRFGGLKQLEPVDSSGNFIIDYSIFDAVQAGFDEVVFIVKKENLNLFKNSIGKRIEKKIKTSYVVQEFDSLKQKFPILSLREKPLGTGHAVMMSESVVCQNFAVINADDFYGKDAYFKIFNFLKESGSEDEFAISAYELKKTMPHSGEVKRGIIEEKNNYLKSICECKIYFSNGNIFGKNLKTSEEVSIKTNHLTSMNMFGFTPKVFEFLKQEFDLFLKQEDLERSEFFLPDVLTKKIKEQKCSLKVLKTTSTWLGLTYKDDLKDVKLKIQSMIDDGTYPKKLWWKVSPHFLFYKLKNLLYDFVMKDFNISTLSYSGFVKIRQEFLKENYDNDYSVIYGKNRVLLSAPHGVSQIRLGKRKMKEPGSLGIALVLQELTNSNLIAKTQNNNDDANFDECSKYKTKINNMIEAGKVDYVLDLHGLAVFRPYDVNLGINFGKNIENDVPCFDMLYNNLTKNGFVVSIDQPFAGGGNTIAGSTKLKHENLWTIQIEVNCSLTNNYKNFERVKLLVSILKDWINSLENENEKEK